jgi:hypothetical protein
MDLTVPRVSTSAQKGAITLLSEIGNACAMYAVIPVEPKLRTPLLLATAVQARDRYLQEVPHMQK